jgi:molybdopterin synthase sulfur carrier subunit
MSELPIRVKVFYFAQFSDAAGTREESYTLPDGSVSVADLLSRVSSAHEGMEKLERMMKIAVNKEIAEPSSRLRDGDSVALFPPIAGG